MHQQQCRAVAGGVRPRIKPLAAGTSQGVAVSVRDQNMGMEKSILSLSQGWTLAGLFLPGKYEL